jgi:hypothetical protein
MDPGAAEILTDAGRRRKSGETVESAVGQAVRRKGSDFQEYVRVMSVLREEAAARKVTVERILQDMSRQEK